MLKLLAKVAEKYAKSTNTACMLFGWWHQPKMPASLIKKDQQIIKDRNNYNFYPLVINYYTFQVVG